MAGTFLDMVNRIAKELRRSNLTDEIKAAINDAIDEAADTRFYLNEVRGLTFPTVISQEYYDDLGIVEVDAFYYIQGNARYNLQLYDNLDIDLIAAGNPVVGQTQIYSRQGTSFRLYPIPSAVFPVYIDGYSRLTPWPLVNDADTNNWMTFGEKYIRALAKAYLLKDVIRDYSEASILEAIAEDQQNQLIEETTSRISTGVLKATQF